MQKHLDNVNRRIKANPWQFTAVFLIVLVFSILSYSLILTVRVLGPVQFGIIIPNIEFIGAPGLLSSYASLSQYLLLCLAVIGSIGIGAFLIGGYLSCLDSTETLDKSKNWLKIFFAEGLKKFVNVFIASLINFLILYLLILLMSLILAVSFVSMAYGSFEFGSFIFAFLIVATVIVLSIFFVFIPYEATFSKKPFWTAFKVALKKASKVFGSLLLVTIIIWVLYLVLWWISVTTLSFTLGGPTFLMYVMSIVGFIMALFAVTFFYFPLYKKASAIVDGDFAPFEEEVEEITSEETEPVERVHKTEFIGSDNYVFHKTSCWHVKQIAPGTEFYFENREEAIEKGFEPCKHCRP